MGLLSARDMTETQLRQCCGDQLASRVVGYTVFTQDGQRAGTVDDILIDDEANLVRFLVVDTSTAEFLVNQARVMLPIDLCCPDEEKKTVRSRTSAEQVQSAPPYRRDLAQARAYEETVFTHYGERPYWPL